MSKLVRVYALSLLGIILIALLPVISVLCAGLVAEAADCTLNEGSVHSCVIAGIDFGGLLYAMAVLGWLGLATIPAGMMLAACWALVLVAHLGWLAFRRSRNRV